MARKRSPILGKAWDLIVLSVTKPMAKVKKPFSRKLLLLKKKTKRFKLLRHYDYAFIREYEFSPPGTPLYRRAWNHKKNKIRLMSLLCGRNISAVDSVAEGGFADDLEILSLPRADSGVELEEAFAPELLEFGEEEVEDDGDDKDDDASVDRRAERFIEKFYEEMRIQRQNSVARRQEE